MSTTYEQAKNTYWEITMSPQRPKNQWAPLYCACLLERFGDLLAFFENDVAKIASIFLVAQKLDMVDRTFFEKLYILQSFDFMISYLLEMI